MRFTDRVDAGRQLSRHLDAYANRRDVIVLALPRGGVPVAAEVARHLDAPLDVFLVRKLGVPGQPELAMGAIAEGGAEVLNRQVVDELGIPPALVPPVIARERIELDRRARAFRGDRQTPSVRGRIVILVDDGLATGSTMEAAIAALRRLEPAEIVVAVPVGAAQTCERLSRLADALITVARPVPFDAVGQWYDDFSQTTDEEVRRLLDVRPRVSASSPFT
jgi:putative phosphoribosyl transferase